MPQRQNTVTLFEDDRGASAVIGFILIFAVMVMSWTLYQGEIVPDQNRRTEIQHSEQVQGEMLNVRGNILTTGTTGVPQSEEIAVSAEYARRSVTVNFAVSGAQVKTRDPAPASDNQLHIQNAEATDAQIAKYISGTLAVDTKSLVYAPFYTRYRGAPDTVIVGGTLSAINQFDDANLSAAPQVLINDRTITIVTIEGNLSKARGGQGASVTIETDALSAATGAVTIRNNESDRNIKLLIPTRIDNASVWNDSLADQDRVVDVREQGDNYILIELKQGTYNLRMAKVGVGSGTSEPPAKYVVFDRRPATTLNQSSSTLATIEVRDTYNNPLSGVNVTAEIVESGDVGTIKNLSESGPGDSLAQGTTGADGQLMLNYTAPSTSTTVTLVFNISRADTFNESATVEVP